MAFARTKIQPPRPRADSLIERPALERRLGDALLSQRLVLLCAAAGFGKTTALVRQLERLPAGTAVAWVACDEGDTPPRLFECLVAALEPYDPPWRSAPEALLSAAEGATPGQRRAIAAALINALDACEVPHGVIVVDDLHRIEHPAVYEFLDALLDRFTPRWTLVIATRHEPPLALARLRAQGEVADFRLDEMRFDHDEALALLTAAGVPASDAEQLYERTQGWPVGLRLALNAPQGAARNVAIDRNVFDFLAAEVIDRLDAPLRDFLLRTSVLPELTAPRCAALTGDAQALQRLDEIERAGLFVTMGAEAEPSWKLHDLFREALEARFMREQPDAHMKALRLAATTETDAQRRVAWLQRAGDWAAAEAELATVAEGLIAGGSATAVRSLFDRFPEHQRQQSAPLQLLLARARWDWDTAIDVTERAAQRFAAEGRPDERLQALSYHCMALAGANRHEAAARMSRELLQEPALQGAALSRTLSAASWVTLARGDQRDVAPLLQRVVDTLQQVDSLAGWSEFVPVPPYIGLPNVRPLLLRYVAGAQRHWPEQPTPLRAMCQVLQGWLCLLGGAVDEAEALAAAASSDARWLANPVNVDGPQRMLNAMLRALRGDAAGALDAFDALIGDMEASAVPVRVEVYRGLYLLVAMRCAALVDDRTALRRLATRVAAENDLGRGWLSAPLRAGAAAHLAALDGDTAEAVRRWRALLADEPHADLYGQVADARLRLAALLRRSGAPAAEAAAVLLPLFASFAIGGERGGEWGTVLLSGPALLAELASHNWLGVLPAEAVAQLAAWADTAVALTTGTGAAPVDNTATTGPLTAREFEVLERIAAGDGNKHIARAIDLSPHTVKRHVANILDKLGVASRGQAAAWFLQQRGHPSRR